MPRVPCQSPVPSREQHFVVRDGTVNSQHSLVPGWD